MSITHLPGIANIFSCFFHLHTPLYTSSFISDVYNSPCTPNNTSPDYARLSSAFYSKTRTQNHPGILQHMRHPHSSIRSFPNGSVYTLGIFLICVWISLRLFSLMTGNLLPEVILQCDALFWLLAFGINTLLAESCYVSIGKRALFLHTIDKCWAVRIRSCDTLFDCICVCPFKGRLPLLFKHLAIGKPDPLRWLRILFFIGTGGALLFDWVNVFHLISKGPPFVLTRGEIIFYSVCLLLCTAIWIVCVVRKNTNFRLNPFRKVIRVPDNEAKRKALFEAYQYADNYVKYKTRHSSPSANA